MFVTQDPLGNPVDRRHPWNQHTNPQAAEARPGRQVQLGDVARAGSTARTTSRSTPAAGRSPGCGRRRWPGWSTSATSRPPAPACRSTCPRPRSRARSSFEWKIPQWSNTIERNRARTYFQAYAAACALHFAEKALVEIRAGRTKTWEKFEVPDEGIGCGFTEAVRGVLVAPHGDPRRQDRQLPPLPADAVERQPARLLRHARARTRTPCRASRSSRRTTASTSRASTSCARCAASTPACPAACTCTSATARSSSCCTRPTQSVGGRVSRERRRRRPSIRAAGDRRADRGAARAPARPAGAVARERAEELVRLVADLYGAGLERMLEIARTSAGRLDDEVLAALAADELVAEPAAGARSAPVRRRRPGSSRRWTTCGPTSARTAATSSCSASPTTGVVRLRLLGSCDGCPSSSVTLELAVEGAIEAAAPEVTAHRGRGRRAEPAAPGVIPVDSLLVPAATAATAGRARLASRSPELAELAPGAVGRLRRSTGSTVLGCRLGADLYAYRDRCARVRGQPCRRGARAPARRRGRRAPCCAARPAAPTTTYAGPARASTSRACTSSRCPLLRATACSASRSPVGVAVPA